MLKPSYTVFSLLKKPDWFPVTAVLGSKENMSMEAG